MNFGTQFTQQALSDQSFAAQQRAQMLRERQGPSATLINGTRVQCGAGQDLTVAADGSASCQTPKDTFTPSFRPDTGLMPPFPHWR